MNRIKNLIAAIIFGGILLPSCYQESDNAPKSEWVYLDAKGKLAYKTDERGNRIMDFSHAGYMGGGVALPDVPMKVAVHPPSDPQTDCTELIQNAIDQVSSMPLDDKGFRGAVLLVPGKYPCSGTITISADGVVLRGSGNTEGGSVILMSGPRHTAITIEARNRQQSGSAAESRKTVKITETFIPAGSASFTVADASGFKAGDRVSIQKPVTEKWLELMQMHNLMRNGTPQTWIRPGSSLTAERRIASIKDNTVILDVPLVDSYDAEYCNNDITMSLVNDAGRLRQVGLENLRIGSPLQAEGHGTALYSAVRMNGEDCWIRDIDVYETMNSVSFGGHRITVQRVNVVRKALHQGASKPAEFAPNAGQILFDQCSVDADHIWFVAVGGEQTGPIVFLNCRFAGNSVIEGHQRWSVGMLLDNCILPDGGINFRNRGAAGSGHGWGLGWSVAWNCIAKELIIQNPPGAANWAIGTFGERLSVPRNLSAAPIIPEGIFDSHGTHVAPRSLYLAQLSERLGAQALKAIGYAPGSPAARELANPTMPERRPEIKVPADPEFGKNFIFLMPADASSTRPSDTDDPNRYGAEKALDGDFATYWMPAETSSSNRRPLTLELDVNPPVYINALTINEPDGIHNIRAYKIDVVSDNLYTPVAEGTTIGMRKAHTFPMILAWKVRITILQSEGTPAISEFMLHNTASRHDFLYAGEAKKHYMYMVKDGKIVWRYHNPDSRGEISDARLMDDGNILFAHQFGITEITANQKVVWSIDAPEGTEIHSAEPIGKEHVVYIQNGKPAKLIVMHIPTKQIKREFTLETSGSVHGQFRNARLTNKGTIIVSHMDMGMVCEYDSQGNKLWSIENVPGAWNSVPLKNDNVLITSNRGFVREVNRKGETVWEVDMKNDFNFTSNQTSYRLPNGNTIINNWFNQWSRNEVLDLNNPPLQAVELTPDKKVVWELRWWTTPDELGPSTIIQPLNEPVVRGNMFFGEFK